MIKLRSLSRQKAGKMLLNLVNMDEEMDARTVVNPNYKIKGCCASGTIKTKSVYKLCTG